MLLPPCGTWAHIPKNVTCKMDVGMFLETLGCTIGGYCRRHPLWWHYRPPKGWRTAVKDDEQLLIDKSQHVRGRLLDTEPPEFKPGTFYSVSVSWEVYEGHFILVARLLTPKGEQDGIAYWVMSSGNIEAERARFIPHLAAIFGRFAPDFGDPFAYWDRYK